MRTVDRARPASQARPHAGIRKHVLRTLALWVLVFLLVELALGLLDVGTEILVLAGAAVLATCAFDMLRHLTAPGVAAAVGGAIALVGVFMALDEADVAPRIVPTLFLGMVATAAGIAIVAVGGGGIQPMRSRWEQGLERWSQQASVTRTRREQEIDLRERTSERQASDMARAIDDTTLVPAMDGAPTQERIRAEIRSDTDTLP